MSLFSHRDLSVPSHNQEASLTTFPICAFPQRNNFRALAFIPGRDDPAEREPDEKRFRTSRAIEAGTQEVEMKNILRALALTGIIGLGAAGAQAQTRVVVAVGAPAVVAAVPACPGVGYVWVAGYYNGPVFVPGRWVYRGYAPRVVVRGGYYHRGFWYRR
jgi:hypothetical protein